MTARKIDRETPELDYSQLSGKRILITGATGLIGKSLVKRLYEIGQKLEASPRMILCVRNRDKMIGILDSLGMDAASADIYCGDITNEIEIKESVDYIIHTASQTSSKGFVTLPVETIMTNMKGTEHILNLAKIKQVSALIYLSTMEVYGSPQTDEKIFEDHNTNIDTMNVRSCYPESKRLCENLCMSYFSEFGVPVKVVRLTQTFGAGVSYDDGRVFAEFARCVVENRDIVLKTKGETRRSYISIRDAVDAILTVMLYGESGQAYNAANESTYCSIYEMAEMAASEIAGNTIGVKIEEQDVSGYGYAPVLRMNLSTDKLKKLGWMPSDDLPEMYMDLIRGWKENK